MGEFVWKDSFNIGVKEIDHQHQLLVGLLNKCIDEAKALKKKPVLDDKDFSDVRKLIKELVAYIATHFKDEERLMSSIDYPGLEDQRTKHRLLTEQVIKLSKSADERERSTINSLAVLLRDWFIQHILEEDKRIGAYMLQSV